MAQTYIKQLVLSWLRMVHRKVSINRVCHKSIIHARKSARRWGPLGVPADLQSADKKGSTTLMRI